MTGAEQPTRVSWPRHGATASARGLSLRTDEGLIRYSPEQLQDRAVRRALGSAVPVQQAAEMLAVVRALRPDGPGLQAPPAERLRRPRIQRLWSQNRRGVLTPSARISGARVRIWWPLSKEERAAQGRSGEEWTGRLEDGAAMAWPAHAGAAIGDTWAEELRAACQALLALPCDCGTGVTYGCSWRSHTGLGSFQDPRAPIEHRAEVSCCQVCGRLWTTTTSGDSHYSFRVSAALFSGQFFSGQFTSPES